MGHKHIRRFRRKIRQDMRRNISSGYSAPETLTSSATIGARHWVRSGVITARQALRACEMVLGIPKEDRWSGGTLRRVWTPARGELWAPSQE